MFKKIIIFTVTSFTMLQAYTLKESVSKVLDTNPIILERLANYKETAKDLSIARSEYLPTLDLVSSMGNEKTDHKNRDILANDTSLAYYENSLTLMWNIFNGFGTRNKVDYQKSRILAAAYNFIEKANNSAFEMTRQYIELIKQRELLKNAEENVKTNKDIFLKIQTLYKAGISAKSEVRKIQSSLYLAKSNYVVQQNNLLDVVFKFKKIYGDEIDYNLLSIPKFNLLMPHTLTEATAYAIRNNPSIMVSNYNIKAAEYLKKQREKSFYPKIDLIAQQNLDNNTYGIRGNRNRFRAGITLTYNLYRGGADKATSEKSIAAIYRNVQTRLELQRETTESLELSWSAYTMLKKQLKALQQYRNFSKKTLDLYLKEYNLGQRTLLDLLSAQKDFINSKAQIITAKYNELFAKYRVLDAMGLLVAGITGNEYKYMNKVGLTGRKAVENIDTLPIIFDGDKDHVSSVEDQCQASNGDTNILANGCSDVFKKYSKIKHFKPLIFNSDGTLITSHKALDTIGNTLKKEQKKLTKIAIFSYSQTAKNASSDKKVSDQYAQYIKKYLVDFGINRNKISIISKGSTTPLSTDKNLNNRVNIIMYLK